MTVGVTGGEIQPVRSPLGQGRLQAVVVRMGMIRLIVNDLQVGELGVEGTRSAVCAVASDRIWSTLIDVAHSQQVIAVIADVADIQREVAAEGVLDAEVVIHHVGGLEIWIHPIEWAR